MTKKLKSLLVCLMLAICFMLTSCDPADFFFKYDELKEKVVSVELINYDNPNVKTVKKRDNILPFDFDKMEIIETLDSEQNESFLSDLSKIHFHVSDDMTKYSSSATGVSIRIVYTSGEFVVICSTAESNFVGEFDSEGNVKELMIRFTIHQDYISLVNKYFSTQID